MGGIELRDGDNTLIDERTIREWITQQQRWNRYVQERKDLLPLPCADCDAVNDTEHGTVCRPCYLMSLFRNHLAEMGAWEGEQGGQP